MDVFTASRYYQDDRGPRYFSSYQHGLEISKHKQTGQCKHGSDSNQETWKEILALVEYFSTHLYTYMGIIVTFYLRLIIFNRPWDTVTQSPVATILYTYFEASRALCTNSQISCSRL